MKTPHDEGREIAKTIVSHVMANFRTDWDIEHDRYQMNVQIHPIISNAIYERDKNLLEIERMETLVTLSRTIQDNEELKRIVRALKYKVII